jgi:protein-S-isoprenylcysteine O-methyltransferase Ste14
MFTHLTDFKFRRNRSQAVGFYIVYLFATLLLSAIISFLYMSMNGQAFSYDDNESFSAAAQVGAKVFMAVVLVLSFLILNAKNLLKHSRAIIIVVIGVVFTFIAGGLLGFIPLAYLTTLEPLKKVKLI